MRLIDLMMSDVDSIFRKPPQEARDIEITGLSQDARKIEPGNVFFALKGTRHDGRDFIPMAVKNGAVAIVARSGSVLPPEAKTVLLIEDVNPRRRMARMAARFYRSQPEVIAAVTGTNGKSSVAHFTRQLWLLTDRNAASMGTLGIDAPQLNITPQLSTGPTLTTPDCIRLHEEIADLSTAGVTHLALEASSHGLDQFRLDGLKLSVAAFTNLTRDHLDYHGSMGAYFNAKKRLFSELLPPEFPAVINADSDAYQKLFDVTYDRHQPVISYGWNGREIAIKARKPHGFGQTLTISVFQKDYEVTLPLVGEFQAMNALCALGICLATERNIEQFPKYIEALCDLKPVRGRMEYVGESAMGAATFVDYAHTPDGLETALKALRPHTRGRLIVVFGCGGDRDPGKRPMMGQIATQFADVQIVTDDNPRSEDAATIRDAIMAACPQGRNIDDRRKAIRTAVAMLAQGDTLLVAGKGHEQGQIVGETIYPFDDAQEVRTALKSERTTP